MPASFWIISIAIFIITVLICIPPVIRNYKKELGKELERNNTMSIITTLRGGLPICALITIVIMLVIKSLFY